MLFTPDTHAQNGPETWRVVKLAPRSWALTSKDGTTLETFPTRRAALIAVDYSTTRRLYDQEGRWFAGEAVSPWRMWAEVEPEYRRRLARVAHAPA